MTPIRLMLSPEDAEAFGFGWRAANADGTGPLAGAAPLQVTRMADLGRGRRVVALRTPRATLEIHCTRLGLLRVFRDGIELR